jgi:ribonuclease HII
LGVAGKTLTLALIRRRYVERGRPLPEGLEATLRADERAGARAILDAVARRRHDNRAEGQRLRTMLRYERELWATGITLVAGIDEAGMSPLAGPVAASAVIFPPETRIPGVDDCKKLDPAERERLAPLIKKAALAWAVAFVEHDEIDRLNIYWAGICAMERAVRGLSVAPEHLLIDGRRLKEVTLPQKRIFQGDCKSFSIAAASILAKTARDARMRELDETFPGYGFARHKGYPVREHLLVLAARGPCPVHRRSFAPVQLALGLTPAEPPPPRRRPKSDAQSPARG